MKWVTVVAGEHRYRGRWMDGRCPGLDVWAERVGVRVGESLELLRRMADSGVTHPTVTTCRLTIRVEEPCTV